MKSQEEKEKVLRQWYPLITSLAYKNYFQLSIPFEDLRQELNIIALKALDVHDPVISKFSTCLITYLKQYIQNIRNINRSKKRYGLSISLDDDIFGYSLTNIVADTDSTLEEIEYRSMFVTRDEEKFYDLINLGYPSYIVKEEFGNKKYWKIVKRMQRKLTYSR